MKSNEFRVGNLIQHGHVGKNGFVEYASIFGIMKDHIYIDDNRLPEYACILAKQIAPIKLTEEWLLKFGFEWTGIDKRSFCPAYVKNGIRVVESNSGNIYYGKKSIQYVHQLQNIYFALTGEELTIKD